MARKLRRKKTREEKKALRKAARDICRKPHDILLLWITRHKGRIAASKGEARADAGVQSLVSKCEELSAKDAAKADDASGFFYDQAILALRSHSDAVSFLAEMDGEPETPTQHKQLFEATRNKTESLDRLIELQGIINAVKTALVNRIIIRRRRTDRRIAAYTEGVCSGGLSDFTANYTYDDNLLGGFTANIIDRRMNEVIAAATGIPDSEKGE